jgi:transketolase
MACLFREWRPIASSFRWLMHGATRVISSFFQFYIYAAPAVRMAALQGLRIIGVGTHDSIGIGEDGPTHQSIGYVAKLLHSEHPLTHL